MAPRFLAVTTSFLLLACAFLPELAVSAEPPATGSFVCPVTPPPPGGKRYGNDVLQTGLYPEGKVVFRPGGPGWVLSDGALSMKFWWWRLRKGDLTFVGKRLDAPGPPLRADVPCCYSETGFQAVGLIFPTPGCWEVTGRVGGGSLTFVTLVEKIGDGPCGREVTGPNEVIGSFETTAWNEDPYAELEGNARLTRATAQRSYTGGVDGIHGTSTLEYLVAHRADQTATFVGYERVSAAVKGRNGTFILQHSGTIEDGIARSAWTIVTSSGTGALSGIAGQGSFSSGTDGRACYSVVYSAL